jgi:hypothetical protein
MPLSAAVGSAYGKLMAQVEARTPRVPWDRHCR